MKLIVFDMDGTLVDSHAFITATMTAAFTAEGLVPPSAAEGRDVIGLTLPIALGRLSGLTGAPLDALADRYRTIYSTQVGAPEHEALYPGAIEALDTLRLRGDTLLGIATGKAMRGVERILTLHALTDYFVTRQTPDHNPSKPHPGMLHRAMAETSASPENIVMVGDTTYDIEMAVSAGVRSVGVNWGSHPREVLLGAGADVVIDRFDELIPVIDQLLGGAHA